MARQRRLLLGFTAFILFVLLPPNLADKHDACRPSCHGSPRSQIAAYSEGTTYKYNFHSAIEISLANAKGQKSKTEVKATVLLTPQPQCNHLLRLQNLEIIGANSQRYNRVAGVDKPIQFHFQDGVIGDHICAETDDTPNSLNIKRAVASLFQVDTSHEHETDVFGVCPTLGKIDKKSNGDIHVTKIRDLNECAYRESIREDFMVSSFNPDSNFKSTPILDGDYMSVQMIKNGILQRGAIFENYTYLTFGDNDADEDEEDLGALIRVGTTLEYAGPSREYVAQGRATESKSIIFDNPHPITSDASKMDSIMDALKELTQDSDVTVSETSARRFLNLVKVLRDSNKDDILTIYRQVKAGAGFRNRDKARKAFLDALFRCGTGNAIVVGVELLKNRELGYDEEQLVYLGFAFVKHATLSTLEAASSLLDTHNLPREAYLGIGNLAGRYCRDHSCRAEAIERLTQRLAGKLGHGRVYSRDEENEMIFVLKALANVQHLSEAVISKVNSIVHDNFSPTRLRVAALETYLTDACHDSIRTNALNILKNVQEDAELRVKAYLVLVKCPNAQTASSLRTFLNNEPSYQVGGFIVSHLRNLQASANPDRAMAKEYLRGIGTNKKFPIDPRKYSFNGEFSYDIGQLGVSSSVESNVIYSQNSFLPRSTSLNLTAELFGHTINFLEVGLRQQNLDKLMEHYFGPLGAFNKLTPDEVEKTGEEALEEILNHVGKRVEQLRDKRDVSKSEIDALARQVEIRTNELNNELDLDLSVKLFGSELFFLSINDDTEYLSPEDIVDRLFDNYEQELARLRNFDRNFETNTLFIDSQFSYPTSLGLPLRVSVEGTSSVQVKAKGSMDEKLLNYYPKGSFKLSLIASANIEVATSVTLDAQVVEGGLKLISNMHTATGGDLEMGVSDNDGGRHLKFSMPLQKQKVISATHETVFNSRELGKTEKIQAVKFGQSKDLNLCINDLSPYIGLNYCLDLNAPTAPGNRYLAGNYKFALEIDNEDFSGFHYKEEYIAERNRFGVEVTAEILGKRQNQKMGLKIAAVLAEESYVKTSFVSPMKTASIEGRATFNDSESTLSYEVQLDNQRSTGKVGVSFSGPSDRLRYTPILEYTPLGSYGPQQLPVTIQGAFVMEYKAHDLTVIFENLQLTIEDAHTRPQMYIIMGNIGRELHTYFSDINLSNGYGTLEYIIKGTLHLQKNIAKLDGHLQNYHNPDSNVHITYEFMRHPTEIDSVLQLVHGRDPNSQQNKLTISDTLIYKRINNDDYTIKAKNKISYPLIQLDAMVDFTQTPNSMLYDFEIKYDKYVVGSELDFKHSQRVEGDYDLDFQLYDVDDEIKLKAKREIDGELNKVDNVLVINGMKYELSGTVTIRDQIEVFESVDLSYKAPKEEPLRIQGKFVANQRENRCNLKISNSREEFIDFMASLAPEGSNSKLKINLRDIILIDGHTSDSRGNGNGEITVDLVQQRQVIKADISYTIQEPTYNFRFTVYPDFKHNRDYITFTTNTQILQHSFDSKNTIDINGQKTQLNTVYSNEDHNTNGNLKAEAEITLPNGGYEAVKYNYNYNKRKDHLNSEQTLDLETRGIFDFWPNTKLSLKEILKDVDKDANEYEYIYIVVADDGRKLNVEVSNKREDKVDEVIEVATIKVYRYRDTDGLVLMGNSKVKEDAESYTISASFDERRYTFGLHGEYDLGEDEETTTTKFLVTLESPNEEVKNLKINLDASFGLTDLPDNYLYLKAKGGFVFNERLPNAINIVAETDMKIGSNDGNAMIMIHSTPGEPVTLTLNYDYDVTEEIEKFSSDVTVKYEKYKTTKSALMVEFINDNHCNIDFSLESSNTPPTIIHITAKELQKDIQYSAEATITTNHQRYEISELINLKDDSPSYNMEVRYPNGEIDIVHFDMDISKANEIKGSVKINLREYRFELEGNIDAQFHNPEDFLIKITANCHNLQVQDFSLEIQNKPIGSSAPLQNRYGNRHIRESSRYPNTRYDRRYGSRPIRDQGFGNYELYNQANARDRSYRDQAHRRYRRQRSYSDQPHGSPSNNRQVSGSQVNRPQMYGEKIYINAKYAGRNLLSGSASYQIREQGYTTTIDGSGSFTIMDERPSQYSYQLTHKLLQAEKDGEKGWEYALTIRTNSDTTEVFNARLKDINKEFKLMATISEPHQRGKPAAKIEMGSKTHYQSIINFDITQMIYLDLPYFGWHEMAAKEVLKYNGNLFEVSGEILVGSGNKYQYKLYSDEKAFEASLTTPQRVVSLEGKLQAPWRNRPGPLEFEVDFYLNKNRQQRQKTSLITSYDCRGGEQVGRCNVELKLSFPNLRKTLAIVWTSNYDYPNLNGDQNLVLDFFTKPDDKIVLTGKYSVKKLGRDGIAGNLLYEVKNQALNVDMKYEGYLSLDPFYARQLKHDNILNIHIGTATYNSIASLQVIPSQILLKTKLLNQDVLNVDCKYHGDQRRRVVEATVRMIGVPPTEAHLEVSSDRMLKMTIAHMNRPEEKFEITGNLFAGEITGNLFPGEITDFKVEYYDRGHPQHLLEMSLRIGQTGVLVYDYVYDENNIEKYLIVPAKADYEQLKQELDILESSRKLVYQSQITKWDLPDYRYVEDYYHEEWFKFNQELEHDRALQDIFKALIEVSLPLLNWLDEMVMRIWKIYNDFENFLLARYQALAEIYEALEERYQYEFTPWVNEITNNLCNNVEVLWNEAQAVISKTLVELNNFIRQHEEEIKSVGGYIVEQLEDIIVFTINLAQEIEKRISESVEELYKQFQAMAILDELDVRLKEALKGGHVPEEYIRNFKDVVANVLDSTQSPHVKKLITLLADYIEQKLRQQPVDDATAIQNIVVALYEVLSLAYDMYVADIENNIPLLWEVLYAIPKIVAIELSPILYILEGNWPHLEELLDTASLDLEDWQLPEDFDAIVAQGQHIFTFDGKHMTFPGICSYILAHDAINKNFSIAGTYNNGLLSSITFTDKHDAVTIRKGGHVLLNQASTELPVRRKHRLEVVQDYASIKISSKAGVDIVCGPELLVCGIHISGYYHAQLRGLLGNANNEPFDDFTLPRGVVGNNEGEFGNAYRIGRCSDVRTVDHNIRRRNPICSRLFGSSSPYRSCYNFVDPENYRTACDHGLAAHVKGTEEAIAIAYVASCATKGVHLEVPHNFAKCTNYERPVRLREEFQVQTPGKAADIVIIIDQDKANEQVFKELLQPLISQLDIELKKEGIRDTDYHIIGYGGAYEKKPYHYTVDGKITFKSGRIPNVQFSKPVRENKRETFLEYLRRLENELDLLTGQDMLSRAYFEALEYPFRAHAVKSVLVLNSKQCEEARLEQIQTWSSLFVEDKQFSVHLFTPFKGIDARDQQSSDVVGFNHDTVFKFSNPAGSKEGHEIDSTNFCVEFALKSRGNVFVTNNFSQGRSKLQFIQIAAQTISKELMSVEQWLDCKCEMTTSYTAQNKCEVTYSRKRSTHQQRRGQAY